MGIVSVTLDGQDLTAHNALAPRDAVVMVTVPMVYVHVSLVTVVLTVLLSALADALVKVTASKGSVVVTLVTKAKIAVL